MSHDQDAGGLTARHTPRTRQTGPQGQAGRLERPSLFAGMEDDDVDDVDADRVRLLSTLSSRGGAKAGRGRRDAGRGGRATGRGRAGSREALWASPWWSRALFGAMALGAVAVLYSFVQVVRQPHAMSARARAAAVVTTELNALAPTAAGADMPAASARIELVPPKAIAAASPASPAVADASPQPVQVDRQAPHAQQAQQAQQAQAALVARAAADAARLNAPTSAVTPPAARPPTAREANGRTRTNEDVALLEAMMKHASARRAPPSSVEALQACAALQGADAAVCRAKACVQHPTAPACHSDAP
ncbi:hypothetical protein EV672_10298 [Aquabacterium commune]|uniref:Uncharacterized protein n=1 Tax=Aquabacterium commune TaxID=70586 RepID=A0A4R6RH51_9BURK|nr:hypothetical protein [Aquabacterium commune]TDP85749.1 hypothetical protein EV672_10298 [Aquabacterium commune]